MSDSTVSVIRYHPGKNSLSRGLDLCHGLQGVTRKTHILIKPNLVFWDESLPFPPYGVLTTTRIVEEFLIYLKEHGFEKITIGEGAMDASTRTIYHRLGYHHFVKRYGIDLMDFFEKSFVSIAREGIRMKVAKAALEAEFLVTMPALKTHGQTRVSLGIKNLKGTVDTTTRRFFHSSQADLDHCIALLGRLLKPGLSIIDGLYGLERGPFFFGKAHRLDALLISRNPLAADVAACYLMGINPENVGHLREIARGMGFPMGEENLNFLGDPFKVLKKPLQWETEWTEDGSGPMIFKEMDLHELGVPKYDNTLCSGCSFYLNILLVMLISMRNRGKKPAGFEFLTGKAMKPRGGYGKTFLLGRCMIRANRSNPKIRHAVHIPGCPPALKDLVNALRENGIEIDIEDYFSYRRHLVERYKSKSRFDPKDFFRGP